MDGKSPNWIFGGTISLICGPMFAGKSTELMRRLRTTKFAKIRAFLIRPKIDDRWGDAVTHTLESPPDHVEVIFAETMDSALVEIFHRLGRRFLAASLSSEESDPHMTSESTAPFCVGIDEGQFLPDLAAGCNRLAQCGASVHVAALDGTFDQKPFPSVVDLIPWCDGGTVKVTAICAVCEMRPAAFTKRLSSAPPLAGRSTTEFDVGSEQFLASCRVCLDS